MRQMNRLDLEILEDLKVKWGKQIKVDYDVLNEPGIFIDYQGSWDLVYKLSHDGTYLKDRWHYVLSAHNAIRNYINTEDKKKEKYKERVNYLDSVQKKKKDFEKNGFRDDLPKE